MNHCSSCELLVSTIDVSACKWLGVLLQLDFPVGCMLRRTTCSGGLGRSEHGVAFDGHSVGVFDCAQAGGHAGFAGGDGLAVAAAVGVFGEGLGVALDFADVGFAFVGVGGDGVDDGVGRGVSRTRVTVWVSGLRLARATGLGSSVSAQVRSGGLGRGGRGRGGL
jgi:hypothetical protein